MDQSSPWGMVVHSASEWDISELHKGGVAFLRIDFRWDVFQPNNGSEPFAWLHFDRIVRWAVDRGMWILAGLGGTPKWAVDANRMNADGNRYRPDAYPARDLLLWDDYVHKVVARYSARGVRYWGIWNEPDSREEPVNVCFWRGSREEFLNGVMMRAVNIIRGFGPDQKICMPDLAKANDVPRPWSTPWLVDVLRKAGRNMHAAAVHVYRGTGDGSDVVEGAAIARSIVQNYNSGNGTQIEVWITETGWHVNQHDEATISRKIQDLVNEVRRNPWVRKVFPYVWSDGPEIFSFKAGRRAFRQQWTGYKTAINAPQPAVAFERDSLLLSHNVPLQLTRGASYNIQMTFKNIGRWAWPKQGSIRLAFGSRPTSQGPTYRGIEDIAGVQQLLGSISGITAPFRVHVIDRAPVPGVPAKGETTFSFTLQAPAAAGYFLICWGLVDDNPADAMFFGQALFAKIFVQ